MAVACDVTRARAPDNTLPYLGKRLLAVTAPDFDFCTRLIDGTFPIYESQIPPASRNAVTYLGIAGGAASSVCGLQCRAATAGGAVLAQRRAAVRLSRPAAR